MSGLAKQLHEILNEGTERDDEELFDEEFQSNIALKLPGGPLRIAVLRMKTIQNEFNQADYSLKLIAKDPRKYKPQFKNLMQALDIIQSAARIASKQVGKAEAQAEGVDVDDDPLEEGSEE